MRSLVMVLGDIEQELLVHLPRPPRPNEPNLADRISWSLAGNAAELARRLARLHLVSGVMGRIGDSPEDRRLLSELRHDHVQTGAVEKDADLSTGLSVVALSPGQTLRLASRPYPVPPSRAKLQDLAKGVRHLHVCGSVLAETVWSKAAREALHHARTGGATTSLDLSELEPAVLVGSPELLSQAQLVLASAPALRSTTGHSRLSAAARLAMDAGAATVVATLGAGGCRIYDRRDATRIPSLGKEPEPQSSAAFVSGYLLGWLLGASSVQAALVGSAARLTHRGGSRPDRQELRHRLQRARRNPHLRKLVEPMREAEAYLADHRRLPRRRP